MLTNNRIFNWVIRFFYRIFLPTILIFSLLVISSIINRPVFLGIKFVDVLVRLLLCAWFGVLYIALPDIKSVYRLYPNIQFTKADISRSGTIFYIFIAILFGIGTSLVTRWTVVWFLPIYGQVSISIAVINGLIFTIPLIIQYEVFKV